MSLAPKIGAPTRALTAEQIEAERRLWTETQYNVSHRARVLGVNRSVLAYHLSPITRESRLTPGLRRLLAAGDALLELVPRGAASIPARQDWVLAKTALTRRKSE